MVNGKFIPLASPDIKEEDIAEVARVLRTGMLIQGREVEQLEKDIAAYVGVEHCIAVSNGTATMHLILVALGIGPGDEVIVPAFSYIATANVVELVGATPIFVDVSLQTFNLQVEELEKAITPRTKAVIPVHEFGLISNISAIKNIADKHGLFVIEDAACALGASENGKMAGSFGIAGSFSLHPRKAISSGEGGLITTNDNRLAEKLRILRNHGISLVNGKMDFVAAGFNYRITDFQAALVKSQLKRLSNILQIKRELAQVYFEEISSPFFQLPTVPEHCVHSWQTFHIVLVDELDQSRTIEYLKTKGIGTNYGAQCIPYQSYYSSKYGLDCAKLFPNALKAFTHGIALPIYEKLTYEDIKYISATLNKITL